MSAVQQEEERKTDISYQYFWPQSSKLSLPFQSHKQTCVNVSRNMQNPDVKNIAVVLMKTKPKAKPQKLNYTKLKDET